MPPRHLFSSPSLAFLNSLVFMTIIFAYGSMLSIPAFVLLVVVLILNLLFAVKVCMSLSSSRDSPSSPDLDATQKNKIMEDLDREAARRREAEQLTRN